MDDTIFGEWIIPSLSHWFDNVNVAPWLSGLIIDGALQGVAAVLGFVPQLAMLFIMLSFLEECGYMPRIAFIMDNLFRKIGLSGKSIIPMLVSTGCGVPGIMASRTIESEDDRRITIMTTTFMPCSAKLPVIALIAGAVMGGRWWVAPSAYFIGIISIVFSGLILKKSRLFSGEPAPFVMELPAYHMPKAKSVLRTTFDRTWSFVKRAGTVIFIASAAIWLLSNFGFRQNGFGMVENLDSSILGVIGSFIAPLFRPLGFGTWQATVATLMGLIAKEEVVGVLGVVYSNGHDVSAAISGAFNALSGYSFLIFNLLCAPCVAAMGAIRREMNSAKWTAIAIGYQMLFAYAAALIIYQLGSLLSGGGTFMGGLAGFITALLIARLALKKPRRSGV